MEVLEGLGNPNPVLKTARSALYIWIIAHKLASSAFWWLSIDCITRLDGGGGPKWPGELRELRIQKLRGNLMSNCLNFICCKSIRSLHF